MSENLSHPAILTGPKMTLERNEVTARNRVDGWVLSMCLEPTSLLCLKAPCDPRGLFNGARVLHDAGYRGVLP